MYGSEAFKYKKFDQNCETKMTFSYVSLKNYHFNAKFAVKNLWIGLNDREDFDREVLLQCFVGKAYRWAREN